MGLGEMWSRTLVYFGIAEEDDWDEDEVVTRDEQERETRRRDRHNVRRLPRSEPDWSDESASAELAPAAAAATSSSAGSGRRSRLRGVDGGASQVRVHLVLPRSFNDAQQIADKFKDSVPVILNLQSADTELSKRLIDFASGLTYALDGSMQRVADRVFLLTPRNVEVSAEERARVLDRGGFFNQA